MRPCLLAIVMGWISGVGAAAEPHPGAVPNSHVAGEVDVPANLAFVVADPGSLDGLVLDETEAVLVGRWQYSTHTPPYVGIGYLHDQKAEKGKKSVTWHPDFPGAGRYEVRVSHCYNARRAANTPVTIRHAHGETTVRIDQREVPAHGRLFRSVGVFQFGEGRSGSVRISNDGTEGGYVIADAVQFLPVPMVGPEDWERAPAIGRRIFSDTNLSEPPGVGCISCHNPRTAFADPRPVSPGAVPGREGTRNAPTLMYAALTPSFVYEDSFNEYGEEIYAWEGGLFLDGRARDQFEQVQEPFFHPDEMNVPDRASLARRLRDADYAGEFRDWIGEAAWQSDESVNFHAFRALVEFLKEPLFRPFDARIDDYLAGDEEALEEAERRGLEVFRNEGKCVDCHLLEPRHWDQPLLSDFGYDNLGAPSRGKKDPGLGRVTSEPNERGQFKAPTLRNVALTAPYLHNGSIATLRDLMEFYNKRDLEPGRWGATDYPETVNHEDLGDLGLSDQQVDDLVALMSAFTDRTLLRREVREEGVFPEAPPDVPGTEEVRLRFPDWTHRLDPAFPRGSE